MKDTALVISNSDNSSILSVADIIKLKKINIIKSISLSDGLDALKSQKISIIISNYIFEEGNVSSIFQYLNMNSLYIPVIIILDEKEEHLKTQAFIDGACAVFTQPVSESYLLLTASNLINLTKSQSNLKASESVIDALSKSLEFKDNLTIGHAKRVADLSVRLYDELGFKNITKRYKLYIGCLLHDIGKIGIPDDILKSEKIYDKNSFEFEELKKHTTMGYEMSKGIQDGRVLEIILNHHEKLDGSGYPRGLKAKEISTLVRIVTISDIYDSLVHKRSYREKVSKDEALEILMDEANDGKISYDFTKSFIKLINT